jgi:hypothetical protein
VQDSQSIPRGKVRRQALTQALRVKWKKAQGLADTATEAVRAAVDGDSLAVRQQGRRRMLRFLEMLIEAKGDEARGRRGESIHSIASYVEEHATAAGAVAVNEGDATREEVSSWQEVVEAMAQQLKGEAVIVTKAGDDNWNITRMSVKKE